MTKKVQKQFATGERRAFLARKYKPNGVEKMLLNRLKEEGLNPIFSYPIYFASPPDTIVDFYFPEVKLAVYIDGGFHDKRFSPENAIRDEKITKALKKEGYQVLRFKDREIRRKLEDCMYKIRSELLPEYLMNGSLS